MPAFLLAHDDENMSTNYDMLELIGEGSFAKVFRCIERKTGLEFAAKELRLTDVEDKEKIEQEIAVWKDLRHENIVSLYSSIREGETVCLIMEYVAGGSLFDEVIQQTYYSEKQARLVTRQLLNALEYLHSRRIVHRDIKPDNLLLKRIGNNVTIKLADFGLAQALPNDTDVISCGASGAPMFLAPETVLEEPIGRAVDIWACGVIFYLLLVGYPPFWSNSDEQLLLSILRGQYTMPSPFWDNVSNDARDLVHKLIVVDPEARISAKEALSHPALKENELTIEENEPKAKRHFYAAICGIRAMIKMRKANVKGIGRQLSESGVDLTPRSPLSPRSPRSLNAETFADDGEERTF
ncbi:calcium/calmodulin-dependent protein kinase type II alpha chain isoform X2 [Nematostella vectensis]|nr:calcium/calmodulin-dependent protein kinase type II alpha chain isoform X2 [Nematostella vectensis]